MKPYNKINKLKNLEDEETKKLVIELILHGDIEIIRLDSRFLEMLESEYKKQPLLKPLIEATLKNFKLEEKNKKLKEQLKKEQSKTKQTEHINLFLGIVKATKRQIEEKKIKNVNEIFDDLGKNINSPEKLVMYKDIIRAFITQEEEDLLIKNIEFINDFVKQNTETQETEDDYILNVISNIGFDEEEFDEEEEFDFEEWILQIKETIDNYKERNNELKRENKKYNKERIRNDNVAIYNMIMLMTTYGQTNYNRVKEEYVKSHIDDIDSLICFVDKHLLECHKTAFFKYVGFDIFKNEEQLLECYNMNDLDELENACISYYSTLWSDEIITIE